MSLQVAKSRYFSVGIEIDSSLMTVATMEMKIGLWLKLLKDYRNWTKYMNMMILVLLTSFLQKI